MSTRPIESPPRILPQELIETINEAVFAVDTDCRINFFNQAAEDLTGYRESEVLGRPCIGVFRSDICHTRCAVKESIRKGERVQQRKVVMQRRDGTPVPISVSTSPLRDSEDRILGAVETIRPLNDVERLNEILARETSEKKAILDSLTEGVVTIDHNWRITSINAAGERMLDIAADRVMGRPCREVLCGDLCNTDCPLARTLEGNSPVHNEIVNVVRSDGQIREVTLNAAVLRAPGGEAQGGVLSFCEFTEVERLRAELAGTHHFHGIIGKSPRMKAVFQLVEDVADSASTVLVNGDSGTGKELVADAIQKLGPRRDRPYIKVNCAVFSDGVLESELFGHERGAFTGADRERRGRFELADTGTLFLDEIGDISPLIQVKLLRVLQERQFERVGGERPINVDVRIVAATHRDLRELVSEGRFREDLYYRLNVIPVTLPPLRERPEDIPLLVEHFLRKYELVTGKPVNRVKDRVMDLFVSHPWPGNVRQLENAVEYAFARAHGDTLTRELLPPDIRSAPRDGGGRGVGEAWEIRRALNENHWHHARAAEALGISRTTLWRRMKKLGLVDETA